jgi:hypothetical protein
MSSRFRFLFATVPLLASAKLLWGVNISSFSPTFGAYGDPSPIDIYGSGFSAGTVVVKFNGVVDPTAGAVSDSHIQAQVPSGAPLGANPIVVTVGSSSAQSLDDFTVVGPGPFVSDFHPQTGSDGTQVILNGEHFTGVTNVSFNGQSGTGLDTSAGDLTLKVNAPTGVTSGPLTVKSPQGTFTTSSNFFATPTMTIFSPTTGRAGTNVTVNGTNFLGTLGVLFNGTPAIITATNNSSLQVVVPVGATTGPIRVNTPGGSATNGVSFVVQPTIAGFFPGFGPMGTSVTITGANFNVGTPTVKFNGVTAPTPTGVTFSQLTTTVPTTTSGPITVMTTDGTNVSADNFYLPASIVSFSPTNSVPGTAVAVIGINFTNASGVSFNGTPAASFHVTNNTSLGAVVPGAVPTGPISVTTPAGTFTSSGLFYGAPVISSFAPTHGLPGTNVTLFGTNFLGATSVGFNGSNAVIVSVANGQLTATVPFGATTGPISVTAPAGTAISSSNFALDYKSDLMVTLTALPNPIVVSNNLVYTIALANQGPQDAPNVQLTNTLPASVVLKAATTTQGTLTTNSNPILGSLGLLPNGGTAYITLTVAPQTAGLITNTVGAGSDYPDPAPTNNTATAVTTVLPLPILSIRFILPNLVRISWPAALSNYFSLQSRNALLTDSWAGVSNAPVISGNERVVTQTNSGAMKFYRLSE